MEKKYCKFNGIKIKNIWPFYIEDINEKFFESLSNYSNKILVNKVLPKIKSNFDEDELEKFNELDNLTKNSKILLMLNLILQKIVSYTGAKDIDLFKCFELNQFNEPVFIKSLNFENNFYAHANKSKFDAEKKYDFMIEIDQKSYLRKYLTNIQLSFFLEEEAKILSGGFSLNFEQTFLNKTEFKDVINSVFLHNLIKHFIAKQLYPLSLENLLTIISNNNEDFNIIVNKKPNKTTKTNLSNKQKIDYENITLTDLQNSWIYFINKKFLEKQKLDEINKSYFENDLFYSILIINLIILAIYEELKIYFTNDKPEIILKLLDKPNLFKQDPNQNIITDFYELAKFLNHNYFDNPISKKIKKIDNAKELIENLNFEKQLKEFNFGAPIFSLEVYRYQKGFNDATVIDAFNSDNHLKILYLLVIYPELFGIENNTSNFTQLYQLHNVLKQSNFEINKVSVGLEKMINKTLCEFNYDYMTFIGDEPSMLIVKNNSVIDHNMLFTNDELVASGLYEKYLWSQIFIQSRYLNYIQVEKEITFDIDYKNYKYHKDKIKKLEDLYFSWYADYYGMSQIKPIVNKIDEQIRLRYMIDNLRLRIIQKDELAKKDKERGTILFAYIVATLIGFINFFAMIFTILTVSDPATGLTPVNIVFITIGTMFSFFLFFILIYFGIKVIKPIKLINKKNKNKG